MDMLFDPLFHKAWLTGLCLSAFLPVLGLYLRLRNEWLAALGLAQMSAATGLLGYGLGLPVLVGGPLGGVLMAFVKQLTKASNTVYAFMLIAGWSLTFLVAANTHLGESLGHALINGQLYFAETSHAIAGGLVLAGGALLLRLVSHHLLRATLFPHHEQLNQPAPWRWHLAFDVLVAISMGVAMASMGLMTAFAMVFIPAWLAFKVAGGWQQAIMIAVGFGLCGFITGFGVAVLFDQPYGPCQVAVYLLLAAAVVPLSHYAGHKKTA